MAAFFKKWTSTMLEHLFLIGVEGEWLFLNNSLTVAMLLTTLYNFISLQVRMTN